MMTLEHVPPFRLNVDEEGRVLLSRPQLGPLSIDLGTEQEACEIMADFLAQRDFGE